MHNLRLSIADSIWFARMSPIVEKLNELVRMIEDRGFLLSEFLAPSLTIDEIDSLTAGLDFRLPEELYELYQWHNGQQTELGVPLFLDTDFIGLEEALEEYSFAQDVIDEDVDRDRFFYLKTAMPFAAFQGEILVALAGACPLAPQFDKPIVDVFEGDEIVYLNFATMLDTLIEAYREKVIKVALTDNGEVGRVWLDVDGDKFNRIRRRLNPGIWDCYW